jgi:hypothetical protein
MCCCTKDQQACFRWDPDFFELSKGRPDSKMGHATPFRRSPEFAAWSISLISTSPRIPRLFPFFEAQLWPVSSAVQRKIQYGFCAWQSRNRQRPSKSSLLYSIDPTKHHLLSYTNDIAFVLFLPFAHILCRTIPFLRNRRDLQGLYRNYSRQFSRFQNL